MSDPKDSQITHQQPGAKDPDDNDLGEEKPAQKDYYYDDATGYEIYEGRDEEDDEPDGKQ